MRLFILLLTIFVSFASGCIPLFVLEAEKAALATPNTPQKLFYLLLNMEFEEDQRAMMRKNRHVSINYIAR